MSTPEQLLDLIGLIYDTIETPQLWGTFLEKFAVAVNGEATSLILYSPDSRDGHMVASVRIDPETMREYNDHYVNIDPWGMHGGHLCLPGKVLSGQELCPDRLLKTSEFFNDFCRPINAFHQFCGIIARSGPEISMIASSRPYGAGAFGDTEQGVLRALLPHLQRALNLHRRLGHYAAESRWRADTLNQLPFGVAMMSLSGRIIWLNGRAEAIIASNDGLRRSSDGLSSLRNDETKQLRSLVKCAAETGHGTGRHAGGMVLISRPSGRRRYQLFISPVRIMTTCFGAASPFASVFLFDPEASAANTPQQLAELYGFTHGESNLAAALMGGASLMEAADQLGITRNTVKTVLSRLFVKTDTNRQAELVRLLLLGPIQVANVCE